MTPGSARVHIVHRFHGHHWQLEESALRRLGASLTRRGAGPGATLDFRGVHGTHLRDAYTLIDLAALTRCDAVEIPDGFRRFSPAPENRAHRWGLHFAYGNHDHPERGR